MKLDKKALKDIGSAFFDIDEDGKVAKIILQYDTIEDIIDRRYISTTPVLKKDFTQNVSDAFGLVPSKYKVDLTIQINDPGEYTEEQVRELMQKNFLLAVRSNINVNVRKTRIGLVLIGVGTVCFFAMLMIGHFWNSGSVLRDIFFYIFDILTTVSFWQAMMILVVEKEENRVIKKDLERRLVAIRIKHG